MAKCLLPLTLIGELARSFCAEGEETYSAVFERYDYDHIVVQLRLKTSNADIEFRLDPKCREMQLVELAEIISPLLHEQLFKVRGKNL